MRIKQIYLSGPISGLTYGESVAWTDYAIDEFDKTKHPYYKLVGYKPLRGKEYLKDVGKLSQVVAFDHPLTNNKAIFNRDKNDVLTCDCVLVNLLGAKEKSIGTMWEMAWASLSNKPIVLVMEKDGSNVHHHAFVLEGLTHWVDDLGAGIGIVKQILLP